MLQARQPTDTSIHRVWNSGEPKTGVRCHMAAGKCRDGVPQCGGETVGRKRPPPPFHRSVLM